MRKKLNSFLQPPNLLFRDVERRTPMKPIGLHTSRTRSFPNCFGLSIILGLVVIALSASQVMEGWFGGFSLMTFLKENMETGNVYAASIRRAPRAREPIHNGYYHNPRRSVHGDGYRGVGTTAVAWAPADNCEEVPDEKGVLYCDGMYYRAKFQGDQVVYVPEAEAEQDE
jgi:hypothetical protein